MGNYPSLHHRLGALLGGEEGGEGVRYKTILLDPPWHESGGGKIKRGADRHYPLIKTADMPRVILQAQDSEGNLVFQPDDNAHIYLWVTNNFLKDGIWLLEVLGFRYITKLDWAKDRIGLGQYFRGQTESCLFGVRGRLPAKARTESTLIQAARGKHSKKPDDTYRKIEAVSHAPYLEMFAREHREGWSAWGNEVPAHE